MIWHPKGSRGQKLEILPVWMLSVLQRLLAQSQMHRSLLWWMLWELQTANSEHLRILTRADKANLTKTALVLEQSGDACFPVI